MRNLVFLAPRIANLRGIIGRAWKNGASKNEILRSLRSLRMTDGETYEEEQEKGEHQQQEVYLKQEELSLAQEANKLSREANYLSKITIGVSIIAALIAFVALIKH